MIETTARLATDKLALAFAKGVRNAKRTWLASIVCHVMQNGGNGAEPFADPRVIGGTFLFRVVLVGGSREAGQVWAVDNKKLHRAVAVLCASDVAAYARIAEGKANRYDCAALVQLAVFGVERFPA